jgi:hypothetical protein
MWVNAILYAAVLVLVHGETKRECSLVPEGYRKSTGGLQGHDWLWVLVDVSKRGSRTVLDGNTGMWWVREERIVNNQ